MKSATIGIALAAAAWTAGCGVSALAVEGPAEYDAVIAKHSRATGVPETLIRRVIVRESKYNPRAMHSGHYGMMQIKPATAKAMGYRGSAAGLLDADVNLTYGVRYLAGAYKVAGGDHDRAVRFYSSGYYYDAKRKGMLAQIGMGRNGALSAQPAPAPTMVAATTPAMVVTRVATLFSSRPQPVAAAQAAQLAPAQAFVPTPPVRGAVAQTVSMQAASQAFVQPTTVAFVPLPQPRGPAVTASVAASTAAPAAPMPPLRPTDPRVAAPAAPVLASAAPTPKPRDLGPETTGSIATADIRRPAVPLPPARVGDVAPIQTTTAGAAKPRTIAPASPVLASAGPVPAQKAAPLSYAEPARPVVAVPQPAPARMTPTPPRR